MYYFYYRKKKIQSGRWLLPHRSFSVSRFLSFPGESIRAEEGGGGRPEGLVPSEQMEAQRLHNLPRVTKSLTELGQLSVQVVGLSTPRMVL